MDISCLSSSVFNFHGFVLKNLSGLIFTDSSDCDRHGSHRRRNVKRDASTTWTSPLESHGPTNTASGRYSDAWV